MIPKYCFYFILFGFSVVVFLPSTGSEANKEIAQSPPIQNAANQEIKQIQARAHNREQQLQHSIQLYATIKKQTLLYPYKNQFKSEYMLQSSMSITRDIFVDQLADQNRIDVLGIE